jgi:hypothetical protein
MMPTHLFTEGTLVVLGSAVCVQMMIVDALGFESFVTVFEAANVRSLVGVDVLFVETKAVSDTEPLTTNVTAVGLLTSVDSLVLHFFVGSFKLFIAVLKRNLTFILV